MSAAVGARLRGRQDGVLHGRGIDVGPVEIYRVLSSFADIREPLALIRDRVSSGDAACGSVGGFDIGAILTGGARA